MKARDREGERRREGGRDGERERESVPDLANTLFNKPFCLTLY